MRRFSGVAALIALVSLAAACSSDRAAAPTSPSMQAATAASKCDFKQIKSLVISDFGSSQQSTVLDILRQMQTAYGTNNAAAATPFGFQIMNELAKGVSGATLVGTAQTSSDLTAGLVGCMDVIASDHDNLGFAKAFQTYGAFEVRALRSSTQPELAVFSRDGGFSALSGPPLANGSDFASWLGGTALIYGWPRSESEFRTEGVVGPAYDWFSIRVNTSTVPTPDGIVALCATDLANGRFRVQHGSAISLLRDPALIAGWSSLPVCESVQPVVAAASARPLRWLADAVDAGRRLLSPEMLHATMAAARTGGGGSTGSFSPFGGVDAGSVRLVDAKGAAGFFGAPRDGRTGPLSPAVVIEAVGQGGTALPGVSITVTVSGNSGSFDVCSSDRGQPVLTVTTGADGKAAFDIAIDKPGGYTLTATSGYSGYTTTSVLSPLFNLKQSPFTCLP